MPPNPSSRAHCRQIHPPRHRTQSRYKNWWGCFPFPKVVLSAHYNRTNYMDSAILRCQPVVSDRRLSTLARHLGGSSPHSSMASQNPSQPISPSPTGAGFTGSSSVFANIAQAPEDPILGVGDWSIDRPLSIFFGFSRVSVLGFGVVLTFFPSPYRWRLRITRIRAQWRWIWGLELIEQRWNLISVICSVDRSIFLDV